MLWQLHAIPTIHNDSESTPRKIDNRLLRTIIPRNSTRKQKIGAGELVLFQAADKLVDIDTIFEQNSSKYVTFKRLDNSV